MSLPNSVSSSGRRSSPLHHHAPFPEASTSQSSSRRPPPRRIITTSSRFPSTLADTTLFDRNGYVRDNYTVEAERVRALPAQSTQWGVPLPGALSRHPDGSQHRNIEFVSPPSADSSVTVLAPLPPSAFDRTTGATRPPPLPPGPSDGSLPSKAVRALMHLIPLMRTSLDSSPSSRSSSSSSPSRPSSPPNRPPTPSTRAPSPFTGAFSPSPAPSPSIRARSRTTEALPPATRVAPSPPTRDPPPQIPATRALSPSTPAPSQPVESSPSPFDFLFRPLPPLPERPRFVAGSSSLTVAPQSRLPSRVRFNLSSAPPSTSVPSSSSLTPSQPSSTSPAPSLPQPFAALSRSLVSLNSSRGVSPPSAHTLPPPAPASHSGTSLRRPVAFLRETQQLSTPSRLPSLSSGSSFGPSLTSHTRVTVPSTSIKNPSHPTQYPAPEIEGLVSQGALAPVSTIRIRRSSSKRLDSKLHTQIGGGYLTRSKRKREVEIPAEPISRPLESTKPPPKGKAKAKTRRLKNAKTKELPPEPSTSQSKETARSRSYAQPKATHSSRGNASTEEDVSAEPAWVRRKVGRPPSKGKGKDASQKKEKISPGLGHKPSKSLVTASRNSSTTGSGSGSKKDKVPLTTSRYLTRSKRKRDSEEVLVEAAKSPLPKLKKKNAKTTTSAK
ncbi:hypothetical protein PSTG_14379 [Puccinia striiformis f. sp. tritici PST-78]|uniref:Uncharacterized protein n=1 Tax=Puccinia striiformis f. sp. tritici PST-78 TaxID=1165861 RepID=A0A0L0UZK9_9BASI|nr:hypothetical protein PSTG_14379 [Puccinia striiformis f. sp. tritici PST-78]